MTSFDPRKSALKDCTLADFLSADLTDDLECVPGIGPATAEHLKTNSVVDNTYQLIGVFLKFKRTGNNVDHANRFFNYLKHAGVSANKHNIVQAICEKVALLLPEIYDETDFYMDDASSTASATSD